jgi:hypothetical protein
MEKTRTHRLNVLVAAWLERRTDVGAQDLASMQR